jgi:2-dehydro-3-deoxyphosphogluconate aldolase/(4S)-4-hydroxy-2-oxoglutarate aldolase
MINATEVVSRVPVIPVITISSMADALPLAEALVKGGLTVLEITLRTAVALEAIKELCQAFPQAMVGAGTLLNADQVYQAKLAGAQFLVSPGSTPTVLKAANDVALPILPGGCTPTELMNLLDSGYTVAKFFPAEAAGGVAMLKALAAPIPQIRFCPTGGITPGNAAAWLALPNVACIGGSWMVSQKLVDARQWSEVERLSRLAAALPRGATQQQGHPRES